MIPLMLLHAFPLDSTMYDGVCEMLDTDTEVVAPDFPGFGSAHLPAAEPNLDVYADFVVAELDRRGWGRVVLAGTSMGGYVSMALARRHPDRLAGLALIDTKAAADAQPAAAGRRAMADRLESEGSSAPLIEAVLPKLLGESTLRDRPDLGTWVQERVERCDPRAAAWAQRAMAARPDSTATLHHTSVPAAVVVGQQDQLVSATEAQQLVEALPDAALSVLPGVGHLSPVEAPAAVAAALTELLGRSSP